MLFTGIGLVAVFYLGGGWYFSGQVYADALKAVPYDASGLQQGTVQAVEISKGEGSITILPEEAERDETKFDDAVMGLAIGESLVVVGPATRGADGAQTREVLDVVGDDPQPGDVYGLTRDVWLTPEQTGLEYEDITLTSLEGNPYPAWLIPGKGSKRWAVLTHGKGAARSEMLRMARPLHEAGYNVIVVTYDGDVGAPEYEDGMVTYGRDEWPVLEAAVQYASDEGSDRIVLGGVSHGGAVTLGFLERSMLANRVDGVILDSPASSLIDVVDEAAEFRTLPVVNAPIPESLEDVAKMMVAFRYGVDFKAIDYSGRTEPIEVPLLTFQGSADRTVAKPVNDRLMQGPGTGGSYVVVEGADHVLSWNNDPQDYDGRIGEFLKGVGRGR